MALALFVPADRPDRFAKAFAAGADAVVIDLEDAVAEAEKDRARQGLLAALQDLMRSAGAHKPHVIIRINGAGTAWYERDIQACRDLPVSAVMLPKAEYPEDILSCRNSSGKPVLALIESALGLHHAVKIAAVADRLVFGSIDFAADLGSAHNREALLLARSALVVASRCAGLPPPVDGVTTAVHDAALIAGDIRHAVSLGFGGKLLIHPAQVSAAREAFMPDPEELAAARRLIEAVGDQAVVNLDGMMVDAPVVMRARQVLRRAGQGKSAQK
ncbi:CoA ester lyase [Xinfangfangia sp. D13-10-4-6]|nr:CoA ester lyase [Pseudogemmobacter hezensis]